MTSYDYDHPFQREFLLARTWPFLATMVLGWVLLPLTTDPRHPGLLAVAGALNIVIVISVFALPWIRIPSLLAAVPGVVWLGVVAMLRHGTEGSNAGYSPLIMLTVLWAALYGSRAGLAVSVFAATAAIALPAFLGPESLYPDTELRRALMYGVVGTLVGTAVQSTVSGLHAERAARRRAEAQLTRQRAFELNDDVVQDLAVAKLSLQTGQTEAGLAAVDRALASGKRIISDMVTSSGSFERRRDADPDDAPDSPGTISER
ncbi:MAG: sensor histidine kinase [Thermoleophilia bacterium]|nr:sensor histidine kinase [Thermoleophilia bacterium]